MPTTRGALTRPYSIMETDTKNLLRRQVECEEKLVEVLEKSNELKQRQLKLMEEQNKLMATTIDSINMLSNKVMEALENN